MKLVSVYQPGFVQSYKSDLSNCFCKICKNVFIHHSCTLYLLVSPLKENWRDVFVSISECVSCSLDLLSKFSCNYISPVKWPILYKILMDISFHNNSCARTLKSFVNDQLRITNHSRIILESFDTFLIVWSHKYGGFFSVFVPKRARRKLIA